MLQKKYRYTSSAKLHIAATDKYNSLSYGTMDASRLAH
jgi:hypothetical protein